VTVPRGPLLILLALGCRKAPEPDTHASLIDAHIAAMEDLASVLDTIYDKKSLEAARPRIEEIGKRLRDIDDREDKLPLAGPTEQVQLNGKLEAVARTLEPRFQRAMDRLKDDPAASVLLSTLLADAANLDR
jgi:hypothetical protein